MKQTLVTMIFTIPLLLGLSALPATAGPGHDHSHAHDPVSQVKAEAIASNNVGRLANAGKIDDSWKSVEVTQVSKKDFGGGLEWVVAFKNGAVSDPKKQTLYVFLSIGGEYLAANFTGD